MDIIKIKEIVAQKESHLVEFKKTTAQLRSAFETVCAFLNNEGGTVLIGVTDNNKILGQEISDGTRQEIARELHKLEPAANSHAVIDYVLIEKNKYVIAITVSSGNHVPYTYDGRAFQRVESTTSRIQQNHYEQLLVQRGHLNYSWEEVLAPEYSIDDLDHKEIFKTVSDGIYENRIPASAQRDDVLGILQRLKLIKGDSLNRAAVVLYAKQEKFNFLHCEIKMARFKGLDKLGEFIDNKKVRANAFQLLEEADAFLRRHLPIASFFKPDQFKRVDTPALPVMAVREALINALCHRDYADVFTNISLAIYDDRLEIWNNGDLPKKITLEKLKHAHESILRNPLIANAFYVRGMIETWGTGTNKMIDLCKKDGLREPEFHERTGGLVVTFKFKEPMGRTIAKRGTTLSSKKNAIRQQIILEFIKDKKTASTEQILDYLTSKIPEPPIKKTIIRDLNHLKSQGLIDSKGQKRGAVWTLPDTLKL